MIHQHHPVRIVLEQAARGQRPTRAVLDRAFAERPNDPHDLHLDRLREEVVIAAEEVSALASLTGYVNPQAGALERAHEHLTRFDSLMTDDERKVVLRRGALDDDDLDYDAMAANP